MMQSTLGIFVFIALAWAISENRKRVSWKLVTLGFTIQFAIAFILIKISWFTVVFIRLNHLILALEAATTAGTSFVFGYLGGGQLPFPPVEAGAAYILGFRALPLILLMSALSSLLFYWNLLPVVVKGFSRVLQKTLRLGGAEGLGVGANIFLGMVESPLFIRPYLERMTRSEIFTLMTCGMATIAGTVMVIYAGLLEGMIPNGMGHILTASIISAPAAVTVAKIMIPETQPLTPGELTAPEPFSGAMDAITKGTLQGVTLLINIIAMLIVLVAMVHLINSVLGLLPAIGGEPMRLQRILGHLMSPVVWLMGVPWAEAPAAGNLLGIKTILNEFIAYVEMSRLPEGTLSPKSLMIMTYALCGFANPGSLGIMIGGMGTMAPSRREEIVSLGLKSIVAGTIATCMTGAVVGIIG